MAGFKKVVFGVILLVSLLSSEFSFSMVRCGLNKISIPKIEATKVVVAQWSQNYLKFRNIFSRWKADGKRSQLWNDFKIEMVGYGFILGPTVLYFLFDMTLDEINPYRKECELDDLEINELWKNVVCKYGSISIFKESKKKKINVDHDYAAYYSEQNQQVVLGESVFGRIADPEKSWIMHVLFHEYFHHLQHCHPEEDKYQVSSLLKDKEYKSYYWFLEYGPEEYGVEKMPCYRCLKNIHGLKKKNTEKYSKEIDGQKYQKGYWRSKEFKPFIEDAEKHNDQCFAHWKSSLELLKKNHPLIDYTRHLSRDSQCRKIRLGLKEYIIGQDWDNGGLCYQGLSLHDIESVLKNRRDEK